VTTVDTLVENIHFPSAAKSSDLGHKSLAVSLSDIAAMGAIPRSALLALTLPSADEAWLQAYAQGFFALAKQYQVDLIGGNITRGPLSITVVANGLVPQGEALLRSGAKVGDLIYVTGTLGDAGLALHWLEKNAEHIDEFLLKRFYQPTPRVTAGIALRGLASAAIDISDGFCADLEKILLASKVGARVYAEKLPLSAPMRRCNDQEKPWQYALNAGEDYELCFTLAKEKQSHLEKIVMALGCDVHYVGDVVAAPGLSVMDPQGQLITLKKKGYEHF
jgi:thiamine-monophosphate kinase